MKSNTRKDFRNGENFLFELWNDYPLIIYE